MKRWQWLILFIILFILSMYILGYSISKWYTFYQDHIAYKHWIHIIDSFLFGIFSVTFLCANVVICGNGIDYGWVEGVDRGWDKIKK